MGNNIKIKTRIYKTWTLQQHFDGVPKDSDLELQEKELPELKDGGSICLPTNIYLGYAAKRHFTHTLVPHSILLVPISQINDNVVSHNASALLQGCSEGLWSNVGDLCVYIASTSSHHQFCRLGGYASDKQTTQTNFVICIFFLPRVPILTFLLLSDVLFEALYLSVDPYMR